MSKQTDLEVFKVKIAAYKDTIDAAIESYAKEVKKSSQTYGEYSAEVTDAYLSILRRGGKRIRGALVMAGYEMSGGKDEKMILRAALAIEMIHAYILIIDDLQDKSDIRRGGPAAHILLAKEYTSMTQQSTHASVSFGASSRSEGEAYQAYEEPRTAKGQAKNSQEASGVGGSAAEQAGWHERSAKHFGDSMAINAALIGNHAAQMMLANLDAPDNLKIKALSIFNRSMITTAHGQINDGINEILPEVSAEQVDRVMEWKTAYYTFLNPLHIGMTLAGAECFDDDVISKYSRNAGKAFQITDDILGTFGDPNTSGKSPKDDLREGKRTTMVVYALEHANSDEKEFLRACLGNGQINDTDFDRAKQILIHSGALNFAKAQAEQYIGNAKQVLSNSPDNLSIEGLQFLRGLADYLLTRTS